MSLRDALKPTSPLRSALQVGKQGLRTRDRAYVTEGAGQILESLDLEAALPPVSRTDKRWDYLLGTTIPACKACGVEIHPANTGEARVIVAKKQAALSALQSHLAAGQSIRRWFWIASGSIKITRNTPEARLLDRAGITLVGSHLVLSDTGD